MRFSFEDCPNFTHFFLPTVRAGFPSGADRFFAVNKSPRPAVMKLQAGGLVRCIRDFDRFGR